MQAVPGGHFVMGSDDHYPEEGPALPAAVEAFAMDQFAVTNAEFSAFVRSTGYRTGAEQPLGPADFPDVDPALLQPGSVVFRPPAGDVDLRVPSWWSWLPGASWHAPHGPGSSIDGLEEHPVVQVNYADASAYAAWAGKALPTETEWEFAARGGLATAEYAWGTQFAPQGRQQANTWQGDFPHQNLCLDGYAGTAPVGRFPPNAYGLYDLIGNVWEWTTTTFQERRAAAVSSCCGGGEGDGAGSVRLVLKGGSYLCAPNYCARYRPAARVGQDRQTSTCHTGFRCVIRS